MPQAIQFLFGQSVPHCGHHVNKHFDYCVLQYMDAGAVDLRVGEKRYLLEGRNFWSSYPGPRIHFRAAEAGRTWVHRYLAFKGSRMKQWMAAGLFPLAPQVPPPGGEYAKRFDELLHLSVRTDRWGHARAVLLLETILTELAEARVRPSSVPAWLEASLRHMAAAGAEIDYERLAKEAGMPQRTFRRRFAQAMGVSPRAHAITCRISSAQHLLGGTEIPIKVIAERLGYHDVSFFSRQFTRFTGVSPAAYRRSREV